MADQTDEHVSGFARKQQMTRSSSKLPVYRSCKRRGSLFSTMASRYLAMVAGAFVVLIMAANPAWAVQTHGGTEGLVSHQIGHFLFAVGMGYLLLRLNSIGQKGPGWFEFKTFLWLLLVWNLMTFSGHWANEAIARGKFIKENGSILFFTIENLQDAFFYLTRLDHLILVPSFAFLLLALRKWRAME